MSTQPVIPQAPPQTPSPFVPVEREGGGTPSVWRRYRARSRMFVVVLVVVASVASLLGMRRYGMSSGVRFEPVKLDYEPPRTAPEDAKRQQEVLAELARSASPDDALPVPLLKNPFRMPLAATSAWGGEAVAAARQPTREEELRTRLAQLTLGGVMQGPVPLARINGRTVREGEMVDDTFEVVRINERSVDLRAEGRTFTLRMSETTRRPPATLPRR